MVRRWDNPGKENRRLYALEDQITDTQWPAASRSCIAERSKLGFKSRPAVPHTAQPGGQNRAQSGLVV